MKVQNGEMDEQSLRLVLEQSDEYKLKAFSIQDAALDAGPYRIPSPGARPLAPQVDGQDPLPVD